MMSFLTLRPMHGAEWTPINTGLQHSSFGITTLTVDPSTPSTLYAYAPQGGLFKSTDAAASWKAVTGLAGLSFVAIDPNNSATLYAATQNGVVKSLDGGESWNAANGDLTDNCFQLVIDPITPTTVYCLSNGGIFRTADGGATWKQIRADVASSLVIDPIVPSTIYAGVNTTAIIKSTDRGENWVTMKAGITLVTFNTAGALVIDPRTPSTLYAGSFAAASVSSSPGVPPLDFGTGTISKSTDGGQTWTTIRAGIPSDASVGSLALNPASPSTIYAGYSGGGVAGILKSIDGGQSWAVISTINLYGSSNVEAAVDPRTPSTIYAAYSTFFDTGTISKSTDAGISWQPSNEGLAYYDLHVLAIDPVSANTVYTGGAGGVFKSDDAGGNWSNLADFHISSKYLGAGLTNVRSLLVNFENPNILYVETLPVNGCAIDEKTVFKSVDRGATWSDGVSPEASGCILGALASSTLMAMDPMNPDILYLGENDSDDGFYALVKSTDGGATWTSVWNSANGLQSGLNALAIDPVTPTTLYAGLYTGVYKSTDGGLSWNVTALKDTFVTGITIGRTDPRILYAATNRGLFKSTDGGASWIATGLVNANPSSVAIGPNSNILYVATFVDGIYKSVDGGRNWIRFDDGLTDLNIRALAIVPGATTTLYAATPSGVFRTVDVLPPVTEALWQEAVTAMKAAAGSDSLNFWQWAWYWQYLPAFPGAPVGFGTVGSISPAVMEQIITAGGGNGFRVVSAEQWMLYFRQVTQPPDPWNLAIATIKTAAGSDSQNFWQWAWYWQYLPAFQGAPSGFGVVGSISPGLMEQIIVAGGGNGFQSVSAEQWVQYYRSFPTVVNGVLNGASHLAGAIAPGELVIVAGSGLGPAQVVTATPDSNGLYSAQLAGTTVLVNGTPVPLISTSATQVTAVVPDSIAGIVQVTVIYQGQTSAAFPVPVAFAAPGIFTVDSTGQGHAATVNQNGLVNTAAHWGDVMTLFVTGVGQSTSAVTIHGYNLAVMPLSVDKGTLPGVMQIKVPIPTGQDCDTQVVVQVGDATSQPGVTIAMDICI